MHHNNKETNARNALLSLNNSLEAIRQLSITSPYCMQLIQNIDINLSQELLEISSWEAERENFHLQNQIDKGIKTVEIRGNTSEKPQKQFFPYSLKKKTMKPIKNLQLNGDLTEHFYNLDKDIVNNKVDNSPPNIFQFNQFLQTNYTQRQKNMKINKEKNQQYELQSQNFRLQQQNVIMHGETKKNQIFENKRRKLSVDLFNNANVLKQTTEEKFITNMRKIKQDSNSQQNRKQEDNYFREFLQIQKISNSKPSTPKDQNQKQFQYPTTALLIYPREEDIRSLHARLVLIDHSDELSAPINFKVNEIKLGDDIIPQTQHQVKQRNGILRQLTFKQNIAQSVRVQSAYSCNRKNNTRQISQFSSISPQKTNNTSNNLNNQQYNQSRRLKGSAIPNTKKRQNFNRIQGVRVELQQRLNS